MSPHLPRTVATWLWRATEGVRETVSIVAARKLREVCLAVALRANGIAVTCLGADPTWTVWWRRR